MSDSAAPSWPSARTLALATVAASAVLLMYEQSLAMSVAKLVKVRDEMQRQMTAGLQKGTSSLLMMPSMVDRLPDGHESGSYFALDIGGTNFRVLFIQLAEDQGKVTDHQIQEFEIPPEMFKVHATALFDYMAQKLTEAAQSLSKGHTGQPVVGFCFSFPCEQEALDKGVLVRWTKHFENEGAVGKDPVQLLQEALSRQKFKATVKAMMNDTVATLAAARYADQDTMMGLILGTGTNACYIEQTQRLQGLPPGDHGAEMIVNMEWGGFVSSALPQLAEDRQVDALTPNSGEQLYEKMCSGMYMGEIVRCILCKLAVEGGLFGSDVPPRLHEPWSFSTPQMAAADEDASEGLSTTADMLHQAFQLPPSQSTLEARYQVQHVCRMVGHRAGCLISAGLAAVLGHMGQTGPRAASPRVVVGIDGGLFKHYRSYRAAMQEGLERLLGRAAAARVVFVEAADGSSMGAAYLAAAAVRHELKQKGAV